MRHNNNEGDKNDQMLNEKQLIKKIASLKEIKPNKDWVSFNKEKILGREEKVDVFGWLFAPMKHPAWAVRGVVISALILVGIFLYSNYKDSQVFTQIVFRNQPSQGIVSSLNKLQSNLDKISLSLNNLKNIENQSQALVMTEVIKTTANNGEEIINQIKESNSSQPKKVLAILKDLGGSYQNLGETSADVQKQIIESCLNDFEQRSLTPEQAAYLEKAREAYNKGNDGEVIFFLSRIGTK